MLSTYAESISLIAYAMIILVLNFLHHSRYVLEADLVCSPHRSGSGIAHAVEDFVEYTNLLLAQRVFKGDAESIFHCIKRSLMN